MKTIRFITSAALILFQMGAIIYARFVPTRYFCWAPYDSICLYSINMTVNGQALDKNEISKRYRLPDYGRDNRSISHIIKILEQYENTYGRDDATNITLTYTVNGKTHSPWTWTD